MSRPSAEVSGEMDLEKMLATLSVSVRPGRFTIASIAASVELGNGVEAVLREAEGFTVVATVEAALRNGWPVGFEAAWLTLDVHSALEAVGLTAAVATVLGENGISCNVLAGFYHDHILVQTDRADNAVRCIEGLRS